VTALNQNVMTLNFVLPSSPAVAPIPASVRGFGAVFQGVELPNTSSIEYFAGAGSLGKFFVPTGTASQSEFLGVLFNNAVVTSVRITLGTTAVFRFTSTTDP